ncbi:hypothetical protein SASPL_120359 [Salvia splendens]|uniref:WRKY domain-containing protein n=1 Tax=Salvia splendens TaxID=180675 RepID=A0A8X8XU45_SALSN|nr:hypothetical protein SASPL_120359 [Salvia splendens]
MIRLGKYGQKPIKGSPYPRGYYRCSSSKGCPARKQVERSSADPNMLIVTYSCDHTHPPPSSRNIHHRDAPISISEEEDELGENEKSMDLGHNQFHEILETPILMEKRGNTERKMAMIFGLRGEEEEEDLFGARGAAGVLDCVPPWDGAEGGGAAAAEIGDHGLRVVE